MIGIGINENVFLEKLEVDNKKNLIFYFTEVEKAKKVSAFDLLSSAEVVESERGLSIRAFPPLAPGDSKADWTEDRKVDMLQNDLNKTKAILFHIASGYFTKDELIIPADPSLADSKPQPVINMFRGMAQLDANNFNQMLQKQEILDQLHFNMCSDFVNLMKPKLGDPALAFRLLLVRQSKDKNFASFRSKYLDENPFWERMEIPMAASKLYASDGKGGFVAKFTKYELDQGLNSAAPVDKAAVADKPAGEGGAPGSVAQALFGGTPGATPFGTR